MGRRVVRGLGGCLLLTGLLLGVRASPAAACSCAVDPSPQAALERSGSVFVGDVTRIEEPTSGDSGANRRLHVDVDRVYRGTVADRVVITTAASGASCGLELPGSGHYVFFVPANEVVTVAPANLCDGPLPMLTAVPASFGSGAPPVSATAPEPTPGPSTPGPSTPATTEPASGDTPTWVPWLLAAAAAGGLATVIVLYRRWLHRH